METFSITTLIWLTILGTTTGYIVGIIIGHEGTTLISNIIWSIIGAVAVGIISLLFELSGVLIYAFIGTLAVLFIVNIFHLHHIEDIIGDETPEEPKREL